MEAVGSSPTSLLDILDVPLLADHVYSYLSKEAKQILRQCSRTTRQYIDQRLKNCYISVSRREVEQLLAQAQWIKQRPQFINLTTNEEEEEDDEEEEARSGEDALHA